MSDPSTLDALLCPGCGQMTTAGLNFCLKCGSRIDSAYTTVQKHRHQVAPKEPQNCPKCNVPARIAGDFCVYCGDKLDGSTVAAAKSPKKTLMWSVPDHKISTSSRFRDSTKQAGADGKAGDAKPTNLLTAQFGAAGTAIAGIFAGVLICLVAFTMFSRSVLERYHWSAQSLVVYAQPPLAKVTLQGPENTFTRIAQMPADGPVTFNHLKPGAYQLSMVAPDRKTVYGSISIKESSPTVIGYPQPIQLPKTH